MRNEPLHELESGREFLRDKIREVIAMGERTRALSGNAYAFIVGGLISNADFDEDEQKAIVAQLDALAERAREVARKAAEARTDAG